MQPPDSWEWATLLDAKGRLRHREFPTTEWWRPAHVEVVGEDLRWRWPRGLENQRAAVRRGPGLLQAFVELSTSAKLDDRVIAFAKRWGILGICERHKLPYTHNPSRPGVMGCSVPGLWDSPRERSSRGFDGHEPLAAWARASHQARALLNVAAALRAGERGQPDDWIDALMLPREVDRAGKLIWPPRLRSLPVNDQQTWWTVGHARQRVARSVTEWLRLGDVRWELSWQPRRGDAGPELLTDVGGLFGAIALELAMLVAGTNALAVCSHCREHFPPKKKPVPGPHGRIFCEKCRAAGVPMRYVMRDRREREREKREVRRGKKSTR